MADIELAIKIPEEIYKASQMLDAKYGDTVQIPLEVIANGTPLPKGHGKLGDLDIILNKAMKHRENYMEAENSSYCRGKLHAYEVYAEEVENAPTIIEADKEESEDKE